MSEIEIIPIINTVKENNLVIHITEQLPQNPEVTFTATIDTARRQRIANNHSATHLMHAALRQVLGTHVEQKGSLVDDKRLRFDFSHFSKMTPEEIRQVEKIVNQKIRENIPNVTYAEIPIDEAKAMGATALFGEKYGEKVRVVVFDKDYSMELCGGCHTSATGNIGMFKIISEGAIAAGIRRIEAITGEAVEQYLDEHLDLIGRLRECVKSPDLVKAVTSLNEQNSALKKEVEHLMQEKAQAMAERLHEKAFDHEGYKLIIETLSCGGDQLRNNALILKQMNESTIAILGSVAEGKPSLCLLLPEAFADAKGLDATKLIREVAKEIQGGGGVLGVVGAKLWAAPFSAFLLAQFAWPHGVCDVVAYTLLFLAIAVVLSILAKWIYKLIRAINLGWANRILGGAFGLAKYGLLVLVAVFIMDRTNDSLHYLDDAPVVKTSVVYPQMVKLTHALLSFSGK